jgi:hypothetical protein
MQARQRKLETYVIQSAIQALRAFCEQYGVELDENAVIAFSVAWATGRSTEWTPGGEHFCRIYALRGTESDEGYIASVIDSNGYRGSYQVNTKLSLELNDLIARYTRDEFGVRTPKLEEQPA